MLRGNLMSLLERIDSDLLEGARFIVSRIEASGEEALLAGGVVRDLVLNRKVSDIDIATSAHPEKIEALFERTIPVGREFGVVIVVVNEINYEVTTFRTDVGYEDGRHPTDVEFGSALGDALRRDFTINSLFLDLNTEAIIDLAGGRKDLDRRLIRTVGDPQERFGEDRLRLMRAVRFAAELDFEIEAKTLQSIKTNSKNISDVSWERIRDEVLKMLTRPAASRAIRLMLETGLLQIILPEVAAMDNVPQPPQFHPEGDVLTHTLLMFDLAEEPTDTLALGILLHDVGKPPTLSFEDRIRFHGHAEVGARMAEQIGKRLRLPNTTLTQVVDLVADHLRFMHVQEMRESTLKRFLRREHFEEHLELHRLDCLGSHRDLSNYHFCQEKLAEFGQEVIRPERLISGHDLIEMGLSPGPLFSEILSSVEDRQLEGELNSREEALQWVQRRWPH